MCESPHNDAGMVQPQSLSKAVKHCEFFHEPAFDFEDERTFLALPTPPLDDTPLEADMTYTLFRQMNYFRYMAFMADEPTSAACFAAKATEVKESILRHNMRLVKSLVGRWLRRHPLADYDDSCSAANMVLFNVIDKFNYLRSGSFSNYVHKCVYNDLLRGFIRKLKMGKRYANVTDKTWDALEDQRTSVNWSELETEIEQLRTTIDGIEEDNVREAVRLRLGLSDDRQWTMDEIGQHLDVTARHAERLFKRGIVQLFGEKALELLGRASRQPKDNDHDQDSNV